jgi:hypothetical protein
MRVIPKRTLIERIIHAIAEVEERGLAVEHIELTGAELDEVRSLLRMPPRPPTDRLKPQAVRLFGHKVVEVQQ